MDFNVTHWRKHCGQQGAVFHRTPNEDILCHSLMVHYTLKIPAKDECAGIAHILMTNDSLSLIKPIFMTNLSFVNEPSLSFRAATHVSGSHSSVLEGRQWAFCWALGAKQSIIITLVEPENVLSFSLASSPVLFCLLRDLPSHLQQMLWLYCIILMENLSASHVLMLSTELKVG